MDRDAFEQLISDWLDDRANASLRAAIDAAIHDQPRLADVLRDWETFDRQMRVSMPTPRNIDWARLDSLISIGVDAASNADERLDLALRVSPTIDQSIDWARFRERISASVDANATTIRHRRTRSIWLGGTAAAALTAAAAFVLSILPNGGTTTPSVVTQQSVARVAIGEPPAAQKSGVAIVRISGGAAAPTPQALFMIDPPAPSVDETDAGYF